MPAARILCVDDDLKILEMLPKILAIHGYEVETASSVGEAVNLIASRKYDVLISDLNMGHVADGFTVVHTMRRVNPDCLNFILTGYPAFESALQALREQVDDYLVKPSDIPKLVNTLERKLHERPETQAVARPVHRLSTILLDNVDRITSRVLLNMKANPELAALPLTDEQRVGDLPLILKELAEHLETGLPNEANGELFASGRRRGEQRFAQHHPLNLMVENERIIEQVIMNVLYENLLSMNLSYLLLDLNKLNDALLMLLEVAITSYLQEQAKHP